MWEPKKRRGWARIARVRQSWGVRKSFKRIIMLARTANTAN